MPRQKKSGYVDGFVLVVSKKNLPAYRRMARAGGKIWRKYGALDYKECVSEDLHPNMGGVQALSFSKMTKLKRSEAVVFSYIVYKSRMHRDQVNKKVMAEMDKQAKKYKDTPMPFDVRRMAYGGFKILVSA